MAGLFSRTRRRQVSTYVAMGDSFTAGNGCPPEERWPDLLVADLRPENPGLQYFNLARDGATSSDVLEQIPSAIEHQPDLVTLVCGANDVILTLRPDVAAAGGRLELAIDRLRSGSPGVLIVTATYPEQWVLEGLGPRTRMKIRAGMEELNEMIRAVSVSRMVPCLDVIDHPGIGDPLNYEPDGIHPSPEGHRQAAEGFGTALGQYFSIHKANSRKRRQRR
jgi:lysophospholipase L1-like esterase